MQLSPTHTIMAAIVQYSAIEHDLAFASPLDGSMLVQ